MGGTVSIERQQTYVLHLSPVGLGKCANNYYFSQLVEEGGLSLFSHYFGPEKLYLFLVHEV